MAKEFDNNRLKRLRIIDQLLSEEGQGYTMRQIVDHLNDELDLEVDRYAVMRDLKFIREQLGISILENPDKEEDPKNHQVRNVKRLKYPSSSNGIFKTNLTQEHKDILSFALSMMGLKAVTNLFGLKQLELHTKNKFKFISYTVNPKERKISATFEKLLFAIKRKQVISFRLRDRRPPSKKRVYKVVPWYLREYNRRWYLFGLNFSDNRVAHFSFDRIEGSVSDAYGYPYLPPSESIESLLRDVVGVSLPDGEVYEIIFWVSDESADFVSRKPIHSTQVELAEKECEEFAGFLTCHRGGKIFKISCKINYELEREMTSFGPELVVLKPIELRKRIVDKLQWMLDEYASLNEK